jgi:hypothetical protein
MVAPLVRSRGSYRPEVAPRVADRSGRFQEYFRHASGDLAR